MKTSRLSSERYILPYSVFAYSLSAMQNRNVSEFSEFYNKFMSVNKNLLRTVGLWPQDEGRKDTYWRDGLTILYMFILAALITSQFYHVHLIWGNFADCLEILCDTTTALLILHKAVTFSIKRDMIVDFEKQGRNMWILEFKEPRNRKIMIETAKTGQKLTYTFWSIVIFTVANHQLAPAISVLYQWKAGVPTTEFSYTLPYFVKLPLDLRDPLQHAIGYIPTTICSVCLVSYISGINAFYCNTIQHLILQLKLLKRSVTDIKWSSCDFEGESPLRLLRSCVNKHSAIIKHSEVLNQIYGPIILGLGVISTLSMCMVIFHVVVTKGGHNGNIALFLMYFFMELSEVLLYCWFGDALTFASSEVCSALYDTDWYNIRRDRKAVASCICIMMIRSQKPIKLTAYKFADVSLKLFTSMMSSTASYFTLLRTLYTS